MTSPPARLARILAAATAGLLAVTIPLIGIDILGGHAHDTGEFLIAGFAPGFVIAGLIVARRRPELLVGWLYLAGGVFSALAGLGAAYAGSAIAHGWPGPAWGMWLTSWTWFPQEACAAVALLVFPDGRLPSRWGRWLVIAPLVLTGVAVLLTMVVPGGITTTPGTSLVVKQMHNPLGFTGIPTLRTVRNVAEVVGGVAATIAAAVVILVRFFRARGERRAQLRWLAVVVVFAVIVPPWIAVANLTMTVVIQAIVATVIVRRHALDIDVAARRTVLAAALLATALAVYLAGVAVVGGAVGNRGPVVSALAATIAVFAFAPLSVRIRRGIEHLFWGRRGDPYQVVAALGQRLSDAPGPEDAIEALVKTLTDQLRLPFVDVASASGEVLARGGALEPGDTPLALPLDHQGNRVGVMHVGHRRGEPDIAAAEAQLLEDLARQVGSAVHAVALVSDLRRARERLVVAREDERRRLQRDLHDGLGARLTAIAYSLDAARNRLVHEPDSAAALLLESSVGTREAIGDVRRLVYALGDPALDSLGLVAAVRDQADRFPSIETGLIIEVVADEIGELPAAVEVAAYRIACEAVNNAVRHSHARHCWVSISIDGALHLRVSDDGIGWSVGPNVGIGVRSMRDRAAELGGTCEISANSTGGTMVALSLPVNI